MAQWPHIRANPLCCQPFLSYPVLILFPSFVLFCFRLRGRFRHPLPCMLHAESPCVPTRSLAILPSFPPSLPVPQRRVQAGKDPPFPTFLLCFPVWCSPSPPLHVTHMHTEIGAARPPVTMFSGRWSGGGSSWRHRQQEQAAAAAAAAGTGLRQQQRQLASLSWCRDPAGRVEPSSKGCSASGRQLAWGL